MTSQQTPRTREQVLECRLAIAQLLITPADLEAKFDTVLQLVIELMKGDYGSIMTLSPSDGKLRIMAHTGIDQAVVEARNQEGILVGGPTIAGHVAESHEPLLFPRDERRFLPALVRNSGVSSSICVPLIGEDGHLRGVLNINTTSGEFDADDLEVASEVAGEIAAALADRENLTAVESAGWLLAAADDLAGLKSSLAGLVGLTRTVSNIALFVNNNGALELAADSSSRRKVPPRVISLSRDSSPVAQAMQTAKTVEFRSGQARSDIALAIPLLRGGDGKKEPLGVIVVESEGESLTFEERTVLGMLAGMLELTFGRISSNMELLSIYQQIVSAIAAAIETRDRYTKDHSLAVAELAVLIAQFMGLGSPELETLREGGAVHDAGKLYVAEAILNSTQRLSDAEFAQIQLHPPNGHKMVCPIQAWAGDIAQIVLLHHVRWDGGGYPAGVIGPKELPLLVAIIGVADAFHAMQGRVYKAGLSPAELVAEVKRCRGTQFMPEVANALLELGGRGFEWLGRRIELPV